MHRSPGRASALGLDARQQQPGAPVGRLLGVASRAASAARPSSPDRSRTRACWCLRSRRTAPRSGRLRRAQGRVELARPKLALALAHEPGAQRGNGDRDQGEDRERRRAPPRAPSRCPTLAAPHATSPPSRCSVRAEPRIAAASSRKATGTAGSSQTQSTAAATTNATHEATAAARLVAHVGPCSHGPADPCPEHHGDERDNQDQADDPQLGEGLEEQRVRVTDEAVPEIAVSRPPELERPRADAGQRGGGVRVERRLPVPASGSRVPTLSKRSEPPTPPDRRALVQRSASSPGRPATQRDDHDRGGGAGRDRGATSARFTVGRGPRPCRAARPIATCSSPTPAHTTSTIASISSPCVRAASDENVVLERVSLRRGGDQQSGARARERAGWAAPPAAADTARGRRAQRLRSPVRRLARRCRTPSEPSPATPRRRGPGSPGAEHAARRRARGVSPSRSAPRGRSSS